MSEVAPKPIGPFVTILSGFAFPSTFFAAEGDGLPLIRIRDLSAGHSTTVYQGRYDNRYVVQDGDILVGMDGDFQVVRWTGGSALLNQRVCRVTADGREINVGYLFHWLGPKLTEIHRTTPQTTVRHLSTRDIEAISIPLFSLSEQRRIAEVLNTVDEAIRHTEVLIAKLKQMKQGLLHDLLTHGLDENGELRDPATRPEQFKDSLLGRLPRGWEVVPIGFVAAKVQDGTHFSPQTSSGPFRYVTSKNVRFGHLDLSDCGWISEAEHKSIHRRCDVRYGDVLLTKDGANTGNAALNTLEEPFSMLSSVAFIRCDPARSVGRYVLQYLLSPQGQTRLKDLMSGNAITRLTLQKIKAFNLPVPAVSEQERIANALDAHDTRVRAEEAYRDKLQLLKKGLMQDLLTGRVRVPVPEPEPELIEAGA